MNMKLFISRTFKPAFILLAVILLSFSNPVQAQSVRDSSSIHIGFVYPVSNHGNKAKEYSNIFSLHALAGVSGGEEAFTLAGLSNAIYGNALGFQAAGISNLVKGNSEGALLSGLVNTYQSARGVQAAGLANIAKAEIDGVQLAGLLNKAGRTEGFQSAGLINTAKNLKGGQLAGLVNKADTIKGIQIAGLVNKAKKVNGVQFSGLINIADSSDYSIGLLNFIKNGEKSLGISTDETFTTLLSFRSGGRVLYGIIGAGANLENKDEIWAFEAGLGAHLMQKNSFRLTIEAASVVLEDFKSGYYTRQTLRLLPAFKLNRRIEITAGPSLNFVDTDTEEGRNLTKNYIWNRERTSHFYGIYAGGTVGIHFIL